VIIHRDRQLGRFGLKSAQSFVLFVLRVAVGWHFLYEGFVKLLDPQWTSAGYLIESHWIFSGVFRWMAETPPVLRVVDLMNIWGLILIGLGLFFGFMTRAASVSGALLLFLYYITIPPLPAFMDGVHTEGSYIIVNKNLVELIALCVIAVFPASASLGIDRLMATRRKRRSAEKPMSANPLDPPENAGITAPRDRREILKAFAALPVFGAFVVSILRRHGWKSIEEKRLLEMVGGNVNAVTSATMKTVHFAGLKDLRGRLPKGRIGNVTMSRLVCGGNLISGFAHSRDLIYVSPFLKLYFSDEKVMETLRVCEACGIDTAILRTDMNTIRILNKYRRRGGKIQWLAQVYPSAEDPFTNTRIALDNGAVGAFIQGNIADRMIREGKIDLVEKVIRYIQDRGVIAGIGGHSLDVPMVVEAAGIPTDFYMKTLHCRDYWSFQMEDTPVSVVDNTRDNYWCTNPEETVEFMKSVEKPWIAYKVLAAGAIKPEVGFRYTFENGADFACVGMFDFQIIEDTNVASDILAGVLDRKRPWMA